MNWILVIFGLAGLLISGGAAAGVISEGRVKYIFWSRWDDIMKAAGAKYGVDWQWVKATAIVESSLGQNPRVMSGGVSEDGKSYGLTQFTLPTANDMRPGTTADDLNIPEISIDLCAKYLSQLKNRFPGDTRKAIISYNQGPGNTQKGNDFTGNYFAKWTAALDLVKKG